MEKRLKIIIVIIILAIITIGLALFLVSKHPCLKDCTKEFIPDDLVIGTETITLWESYTEKEIQEAVNVINNILKTKDVKIRIEQFGMAKDENGNFLPYTCFFNQAIGQYDCSKKKSIDKAVEIFKENGWNMYPIFSQMNKGKFIPINDEIINDYVNWIEWFLDRYSDEINIVRIEPGNNPAKNWGNFKNRANNELDEFETFTKLAEQQNLVYDRLKFKYPDLIITSPGFEFHSDKPEVAEGNWAINMLKFFLDSSNGAKYDALAIHGFPPVIDDTNPHPGDCINKLCRGIPTRIPIYNKYAGVYGVREIRKTLDKEGWEDREIYHTENWFHLPKDSSNVEQDKIIAAFYVQDFLLRKTLQYNGKPVLSEINSMLVTRARPHSSIEGSLLPDGGTTYHLESLAFLWEKLREYNYDSKLSGDFSLVEDFADQEVWVEKFKNTSLNKELYVFFKPFNDEAPHILDGEIKKYILELDTMPLGINLYNIHGDLIETIIPRQTITLKAENSPKYLEVSYK